MSDRQVPTTGKTVLCYWPALWVGARPGIIVQPLGDDPDCCCQVNVFVDGANDQKAQYKFRNSPEGNTLSSVRVYESGTVKEHHPEVPWCEWLPQ